MRKSKLPVILPTLLVSTFFATSSASATPAIAAYAEPPEPGERRTEVNLGMLAGGSDIAQTQRQTVGLNVSAGRRFGDLVLLGEYSYLAIGDPESESRGTMNRIGALARYSLLRTSDKRDSRGRVSPIGGDYWIEGGAALQRLTYEIGGTLTRPELAFGFGAQFDVAIGRKDAKPRYFGPFVAFRASVARAPVTGPELEPTCGGPCDTASTPSDNDVSMFVNFGFNWGR